jgi:aminopeptidase N
LGRTLSFLTFLVLLILSLDGCNPKDTTISILDSETKAPIEGAMVFEAGSSHIFRSDIYGQVTLPAEYADGLVCIHAKNYRHRNVHPSTISGVILLEFDEMRVNPKEREMKFTKKDSLRGSYGPFRENNDLLFYGLSVKLDAEQKFLSGKNSIRFKMLRDDDRIQIDLFENMNVDSILFDGRQVSYDRDFNAVFIDFPQRLKRGGVYTVDFYYSGHPIESGRFGGLAFKEDSLGNPWIFTACQVIGASLWWPNKDQQPDEVDSMTISVAVPSDLVDVSNGRFIGKEILEDGYTRYDWKVHYPINNYSVSLNIGKYTHFSETLGELTLDYYVLPYHVKQARRQFTQVKPMLECYQKYFGEYPFLRDGYKLVEVPYSGMEHQSAVTYGNLFKNGYLGRDWTGVGVSMKFDFIIIHESGHEWVGNSVTANDVSDAWIHEGWCTYAEAVYVECMFSYADAIKYLNGYRSKVKNEEPIIGPTAVNHWPTKDQYFKGALFLNTLRHVVDNDNKWWALIKNYNEHFKYRNIWTTDVINFFNDYLGWDLRPIFEQYLYYWKLPVLQYKFVGDKVEFRWQADVDDFNMSVKIRSNGSQHFIYPTTEWKSEPFAGSSGDEWQVETDLFYIEIEELASTSHRNHN